MDDFTKGLYLDALDELVTAKGDKFQRPAGLGELEDLYSPFYKNLNVLYCLRMAYGESRRLFGLIKEPSDKKRIGKSLRIIVEALKSGLLSMLESMRASEAERLVCNIVLAQLQALNDDESRYKWWKKLNADDSYMQTIFYNLFLSGSRKSGDGRQHLELASLLRPDIFIKAIGERSDEATVRMWLDILEDFTDIPSILWSRSKKQVGDNFSEKYGVKTSDDVNRAIGREMMDIIGISKDLKFPESMEDLQTHKKAYFREVSSVVGDIFSDKKNPGKKQYNRIIGRINGSIVTPTFDCFNSSPTGQVIKAKVMQDRSRMYSRMQSKFTQLLPVVKELAEKTVPGSSAFIDQLEKLATKPENAMATLTEVQQKAKETFDL
jgi:hypothetical protein